MLSPIIRVKEIPGTYVHLVKHNRNNPARNKEDIVLFRDGYWEVHISSTGEHPDFKMGYWKILLVTPARKKITFEIQDGQGLWFVPISQQVRPISVKTSINSLEMDGTWFQFPGFVITLSDHNEIRIQCDEIKPIISKALN